jgi:FAD/FMN-containing dehydrogenase
MSRFNVTKVNVADETVEVGPGLTWDQVYETLSLTGVNVVGARLPGVGVGGVMLGGGKCLASSDFS